MLRFLTLVACIMAPAWCASAPPATICWISNVAKEGDGARIYFLSSLTLTATLTRRDESYEAFPIKNGVPGQKGQTAAGVAIHEGEALLVYQLSHDSCTLRLQRVGPTLGVAAEARMRVPGLPVEVVRQFLPIE